MPQGKYKLLYNEQLQKDALNIFEYINVFTESVGLPPIDIDVNKVGTICRRIRDDFPCGYGLENASIFKKAAVFIACFIESSPLDKDLLINTELPAEIKSKNFNAVIALGLAFKFMSLAKVTRSDGEIFYINKGIKLSWHSYCDILDMLSHGISLSTHFMVLSLLFEQMVYKTHKEIQYKVQEFALEPNYVVDESRYPSFTKPITPVDDWDDYVGFWYTNYKK